MRDEYTPQPTSKEIFVRDTLAHLDKFAQLPASTNSMAVVYLRALRDRLQHISDLAYDLLYEAEKEGKMVALMEWEEAFERYSTAYAQVDDMIWRKES